MSIRFHKNVRLLRPTNDFSAYLQKAAADISAVGGR
jgi:hypothetical protein